jgi:hypothetical protein
MSAKVTSKLENYIAMTRAEIISVYGRPTDYKQALKNASDLCEDYSEVYLVKIDKLVRQPKAPPEVLPFTSDLFGTSEDDE